MARVLVRNIDKTVVDQLKKQAEENIRSLQDEAKAILESAATDKSEAVRSWKRLRDSIGRSCDDHSKRPRQTLSKWGVDSSDATKRFFREEYSQQTHALLEIPDPLYAPYILGLDLYRVVIAQHRRGMLEEKPARRRSGDSLWCFINTSRSRNVLWSRPDDQNIHLRL